MKAIRSILVTFIAAIYTLSAHSQTITNLTTADGLPHNDVLCISVDWSNIMWFGTQDGVASYDGSSMTVYNTTTDSEIPHNTITAILVTSKNMVWIGTDFGAAMFDGANWTSFSVSDGMGSDRIKNIFEAENGDIWFSDFKGATIYDGSTFTTLGTAEGLPFGGVEDVSEADNGDILLATGLDGLFVYDGTNLTAYKETEGLVNNSTSAIALQKNGNLWVGTGEGVSVFDDGYNFIENHTKMYLMPPPDTLNPVQDIVIDSRGNVWVGIYVDYLVTVGGVAMYDGSQWLNYDVEDGLAGPTIRKMTLDKKNNIWVGTSAGVSMIESPYLSVDEQLISNTSIYPIPATNEIQISFDDFNAIPEVMELFNAQGQLVVSQSTSNSMSQHIDVSQLAKGIYFLSLGNEVKKVLVE